jgi:choice-of-anchor A domain-containing protein
MSPVKSFSAALVALGFASVLAPAAHASLIPTTGQDYSVIAFGNFTPSGADVTGRLAVEGNATVSNYGVGSALTGSPSGASLVVGGNLTWTNGMVFDGDTRVGGSASVVGFGSSSGTHIYYGWVGTNPPPSWNNPVEVANGGILPTFFSNAFSYATTLNQTLSALTPTGVTSTNPQGYLSLTGTASGLNVFNVTAAQLSGSSGQGIKISAPAGSTVVINVVGSGGAVSVANMGISLQGIAKQDIVWNFVDASQFDPMDIGWLGSILAPETAFDGTWGNVDGDVVVASVTGSTEFHDYEFQGTLPPPVILSPPEHSEARTPAPEPSGMLVLLSGMLGLLGFRRLIATRHRRLPTWSSIAA